MCFTIEIHRSRKAIEKRFSVSAPLLRDFDFNLFYRAFDHPLLPVITLEDPGKVQMMRWGLVPTWTRSAEEAEKLRQATLNARSESLHEKASFRHTLQRQRCLIPVGGFFEWQHVGRDRIPWYISRADTSPFALAGIFDSWKDPDNGNTWKGFSVITTAANPLMQNIHNSKKRMPLILHRKNEKVWLNAERPAEELSELMLPFPESELKAITISKKIGVKSADPKDLSLIEPVEYYSTGKLF